MKKLFIVCVLFSAIAVSNSYAQTNLKIGYTNVDYVLNLLPEAKEIEAELTAYGKQLESQLQSKPEYTRRIVAIRAGDFHETTRVRTAVRAVELGIVGEVEDLRPELKSNIFGNSEGPEN